MNDTTMSRLAIVQRVVRGELGQAEAAATLRLSVRQVRRIALRYRQQGPGGLAHRLQGRPANNRTPEGIIQRVILLVRTRYAKLGPKSAAKRLAEEDGIIISRETLRRSMIKAGLWEPGRGRV
jgi:transposase